MNIKLNVNNRIHNIDINPEDRLLNVLRDLSYTSVRCGCGSMSCGLCTVLIDDLPKLSCATLAIRCQDSKITTLEGLTEETEKLREYMAEEGADQCGYCSAGFIVNLVSLKRSKEKVNEQTIKEYLSGNLCRCTGYESQLRAVKKYLEV